MANVIKFFNINIKTLILIEVKDFINIFININKFKALAKTINNYRKDLAS